MATRWRSSDGVLNSSLFYKELLGKDTENWWLSWLSECEWYVHLTERGHKGMKLCQRHENFFIWLKRNCTKGMEKINTLFNDFDKSTHNVCKSLILPPILCTHKHTQLLWKNYPLHTNHWGSQPANPSFDMTTTKTLRSVFLWRASHVAWYLRSWKV